MFSLIGSGNDHLLFTPLQAPLLAKICRRIQADVRLGSYLDVTGSCWLLGLLASTEMNVSLGELFGPQYICGAVRTRSMILLRWWMHSQQREG